MNEPIYRAWCIGDFGTVLLISMCFCISLLLAPRFEFGWKLYYMHHISWTLTLDNQLVFFLLRIVWVDKRSHIHFFNAYHSSYTPHLFDVQHGVPVFMCSEPWYFPRIRALERRKLRTGATALLDNSQLECLQPAFGNVFGNPRKTNHHWWKRN